MVARKTAAAAADATPKVTIPRKSATRKAAAPKPPVEPDIEELEEEDDEVEVEAKAPATDGPVERDEYTAKQIATRLGVDAKVLRKFFRDPISTVEPCGQGGRYVFDAADLPKIKEEFEKYNSTKKPRGRQPAGDGTTKTTKSRGRQAPAAAAVIAEDDELLDLDDLEEEDEPTIDDLEELDDEPDIEDIDEFDEDDDLAEDDDIEELDD